MTGRDVLPGELLGKEVFLNGPDLFDIDVAGESHHQAPLAAMAGPRSREAKHFPVMASLTREPENPYDENAVAVQIDGCPVGYLHRIEAEEWANAIFALGPARVWCNAQIVGGWYRGPDDQGSYGVRLDVRRPFSIGGIAEPPPPRPRGFIGSLLGNIFNLT